MTHPEQIEFITRTLAQFPELKNAINVIEVGSLNVNGTVRDYFKNASYIGIDLGSGDGVDFRCPGELLELPSGHADIVCSTECLEHAEQWQSLLLNIVRICKPGGLMLLTFAGIFRPCHGTIDSNDPESSPFTNSYYRNIDKDSFFSSVNLAYCFDRYCYEANTLCGDSYFWGVRSSALVDGKPANQEFLINRLARAQGQLAQALSRLAKANKKIADLQQSTHNRKGP